MENTYTHVAETLHLARKNGDKFAVTVLSTLLGEMQNKIPKDATSEQQHTQATAIVKKFIEGVNENLAHRGSDHPALFRELAILEAFMPMQLKPEELQSIVATIVADVGSLARLPLILTDGHLRELVLTGKDIDAARAEKIGLVNNVYDDPEASLAAAHATAAEIAANPPLTVAGVKDVLDQQRIARVSESLRYVAAWNSAFLPSKDLAEAVTAMFQKRAPQFTGE